MMDRLNQIEDGFIMTFLRTALIASASILLISACGSGDPENQSSQEYNVKKQSDAPVSSPTTSAEPAADKQPSLEFTALPAPYNTADYARGRRTFKLCQSCHTLKPEGNNLVGPKLYGMFGREIGAVEGFSYSSAVSEADFIWTPEKLDEWLTSPRSFLPGNRMSFAGVRKPQDRLAVIAYIMSETGYSESDE